jgi:hypothetical protein
MDVGGLNRWADSISSVVKRTELNLGRLKARSSTPSMGNRGMSGYRSTGLLLPDDSVDQLPLLKESVYDRPSADPTQGDVYSVHGEMMSLRSALETTAAELRQQSLRGLSELRDRFSAIEVKLATLESRRSDMNEVRRVAEDRSDVKLSILSSQMTDFARLTDLRELEVTLKGSVNSRLDETRMSLELNKRQLSTLKEEILMEVFGKFEALQREMLRPGTLGGAIDEVRARLDDRLGIIDRKVELQLSRIRQECKDEVKTAHDVLDSEFARKLGSLRASLPKDTVSYEVLEALESGLQSRFEEQDRQLSSVLQAIEAKFLSHEQAVEAKCTSRDQAWRKELQQITSIDIQGELQGSVSSFQAQIEDQAAAYSNQLTSLERKLRAEVAAVKADRPKPQEFDASGLQRALAELQAQLNYESQQRASLERSFRAITDLQGQLSHEAEQRASLERHFAHTSERLDKLEAASSVRSHDSVQFYTQDIATFRKLSEEQKADKADVLPRDRKEEGGRSEARAVSTRDLLKNYQERPPTVSPKIATPPLLSQYPPMKTKLQQFKFEIKDQPISVTKDSRTASPLYDKLKSLGEEAREVSRPCEEPTSFRGFGKEPSSPLERPMSLSELATESLRLNEKPSSGFAVAKATSHPRDESIGSPVGASDDLESIEPTSPPAIASPEPLIKGTGQPLSNQSSPQLSSSPGHPIEHASDISLEGHEEMEEMDEEEEVEYAVNRFLLEEVHMTLLELLPGYSEAFEEQYEESDEEGSLDESDDMDLLTMQMLQGQSLRGRADK